MSYFRRQRDTLIHVAESDPRKCRAFCSLLRLEGYEVDYSFSPDELLQSIAARSPDLVILDAELGPDVLSTLRQTAWGLPVVLLQDCTATAEAVDQAVSAMKSGAAHVLASPIDGERLLRTIRAVLDQAPVPRAGMALAQLRVLTPREREVLQGVVDGASNKEAGRKLGISPRTVEVHRARIMAKLGARNVAQLVRIVLTR